MTSPPIPQHHHTVLLCCWPSVETSRQWWWSMCGLPRGSPRGFSFPPGARAFGRTLISSINSSACLQGLVYRERRWFLLSGSLLPALPSLMEHVGVLAAPRPHPSLGWGHLHLGPLQQQEELAASSQGCGGAGAGVLAQNLPWVATSISLHLRAGLTEQRAWQGGCGSPLLASGAAEFKC